MMQAKPKAFETLAPADKAKPSHVGAVPKVTPNSSLHPHGAPFLAPSLPTLLSVEATAVQLSVSTKTVRRLIKSGALPSCRVGRLVRIRAVDLARFIASGTEG